MAGGTRRGKKPWQYAVAGEWPYAVMDGFLPAQVGQAVARALAEAMEQQKFSANSLAAASGVNRQVISNVLAGTAYADMVTIASLEGALGEMLWPRHVDWPTDENGVRQQPLPPQKQNDLD
ncbi:helix-turn-helix transcriptional regulator [Streptomyces sp. NBC_00347]|uniref:helix-turn-helix domain-containing protein n=1 Tax=Streptomyces sp. NBC_00347 TaxID=2975721 RepID=UPI00224D7124|nr:helix-turn-helix transcriptional regulator [Streptomyces sp. NBC_00347]MCX5124580.1 helix-turn-helix transcriptional regulator [Streptomyces sp. NBC_00347]